MRFDRSKFFEGYRRSFGPIEHQYQVDGLNRLLTGFETYYGWWDDVRQIASALAQVGWETAHSYTPVEEGYYLGDPDEPGYFDGENSERVKRLQKSFRYFPFFGRGDIQLTWAENFADQTKLIRKYFPDRVTEFEQRTGKKFDMVADPDQALDGWISFCIFTLGMHLGTFREGHHLDRYITPSRTDYFNARNIVNGDKNYKKQGKKIGDHIAEASKRFESILKGSLISGTDSSFDVPLSPGEVDHVVDSLDYSTDGSAEPLVSPPYRPAPKSVDDPEPGAASGVPGEGDQLPIGDPPDAEPKSWFCVEDWKPFVARWLGRLWTGTGTTSFLNLGGNATGMLTDPDHWYIYAIVAVVILVLVVGFAFLVSLVLIAIWFWNRKEINTHKLAEFEAKADPNKKNIGLQFDPK